MSKQNNARAEPTLAEIEATRAWLRKRGVEVDLPTRMLTVRIGPRQSFGIATRPLWHLGSLAAAFGLFIASGFLPVVDYSEMAESRYVHLGIATIQLGIWLSFLYRERQLGGLPDRRSGRPSALEVLGGWYLVSLLITFVGGGALGVTMYLTTPARTYAWTWLAGLGWAALCCSVILLGTLLRGVRADDEASAAVDRALRNQDCWMVVPGIYALAALVDPLFSHRSPAGFTWWLVLYAVVSIATTVIGVGRLPRHLDLPLGDYETSTRHEVEGGRR
ncbi:hypothetical protein [Amycolatopsis sp. lyj-112]|uniref:hypothetical protein n=1 Tax=Amycolatopsis sp. lyj-112 TaxID=2789288 RepID=UPI00397C77F8